MNWDDAKKKLFDEYGWNNVVVPYWAVIDAAISLYSRLQDAEAKLREAEELLAGGVYED